jgi:hypothetical protein
MIYLIFLVYYVKKKILRNIIIMELIYFGNKFKMTLLHFKRNGIKKQ